MDNTCFRTNYTLLFFISPTIVNLKNPPSSVRHFPVNPCFLEIANLTRNTTSGNVNRIYYASVLHLWQVIQAPFGRRPFPLFLSLYLYNHLIGTEFTIMPCARNRVTLKESKEERIPVCPPPEWPLWLQPAPTFASERTLCGVDEKEYKSSGGRC